MSSIFDASLRAAITERYADQKMQASGVYHLWQEERLYGFAKTATPSTAGVYDWNGSSFAFNMA